MGDRSLLRLREVSGFAPKSTSSSMRKTTMSSPEQAACPSRRTRRSIEPAPIQHVRERVRCPLVARSARRLRQARERATARAGALSQENV
jgi:hypothetical protein